MARQFRKLDDGNTIDNASPESVGGPGTGEVAINLWLTLRNRDAGTQTCEVWLVPSGGSASDNNKIGTVSLTTGEDKTVSALVGHVLEAGDTVQLQASAANSINAVFSATIVTG